jgi:hypothetical protein
VRNPGWNVKRLFATTKRLCDEFSGESLRGRSGQNICMSKMHSLRAFLIIITNAMNKKVSMEIINPNAAGIDVGSRSHEQIPHLDGLAKECLDKNVL